MKIKKEIRVLGIDDSPFSRKMKNVLVIGTIFRGGNYIDGLLSCYVKRDGNDATNKLIEIINKTRHHDQLQCIMLNGIALAGFNVIDINKLCKKTKLPVIVVIRKYPNFEKIEGALKKIGQYRKMKLMENAGEIYKTNEVYIQIAGIKLELAKKIIKITSTHSNIPEPIRVAHLISSGIVLGESHGRA